jgi:hypothetical protein
MKIIERLSELGLPLLVLIALPLIDGYRPSLAEKPELSTVTFYVQWYDVGKSALEGLDGIKRVDKGFHNFKEINTVYYEASTVTIEEMEDALRKSGTYRGTVK